MIPKVTVLLRAYNAEKFIAKAVESVLNQTEGDFEFFIRNNGSTDKTGEIIKSFKDSRIVYLENKVNWVLDPGESSWWPEFHGEYIALLDADDYLDPRFIEVMYAAAKKRDADLTVCGHIMFLEDHPEQNAARIPPEIATKNLRDLKDIFIDLYGSLRTVWGKLYKREFYLEHNQFAFNCPIPLGTIDTYSVLGYLQKCRSFVSIGQTLYYYCIRDNSASRPQKVELKRIKEAEYLFNRGLETLQALNIWTQKNQDSLYMIHKSHIERLRDLVQKSKVMKPIEKVRYFEAILNDTLYSYYALPFQVREQTLEPFMIALKDIFRDELDAYIVGKQEYLARYYLCDREIRSGQISALTLPRLLSVVSDSNNQHMIGTEFLALKWQINSESIRSFLKKSEEERVTALKDIKAIREIFSQSDNPDKYQADVEKIQDFILENQWEAALNLMNEVSANHPLSKECLYLRIYLSYQFGELEFAMDACNIALFFWKDDPDIQEIAQNLIREVNREDYLL